MNTSARRLLAANFISSFGSSLTGAALPLVYLNSGIVEGVGVFHTANKAGMLLGSLILMGLVDRLRKNKIAAVSDVARALLLLPLAFMGQVSIGFVVALAFVESLFEQASFNAIQAWIGIISKDSVALKKMNSLLEISSWAGMAAGPLLAALLIGTISAQSLFLIDAATYVIGALLIWNIKIESTPAASTQGHLKEGLRYCLSRPMLLGWIAISCLHFFPAAFMDTVYVPILKLQLEASEKQIVFFQNAFVIGLLGGSLLYFRSKLDLIRNLQISNALLILSSVLYFAVGNYALMFVASTIRSFAMIYSRISTRSFCQGLASDQFIGRVMTFRLSVINLVGLLAYPLGIYLYRQVGGPWTALIGGLFAVAAMVLTYLLGNMTKATADEGSRL